MDELDRRGAFPDRRGNPLDRPVADVAHGEHAAERAVEHARRAGEAQEEASGLGHLAVSAAWGRTPVPDGIRRTEAILAQAGGRRDLEAAGISRPPR
jgi:hypothetical protein